MPSRTLTIKEDNTMPLTINTNHAAVTASYHLSKNHSAMQKSLARLSSGSKVTNSSDDAGGLAVSMKLSGSITRLKGVNSNIQNAVSFLEVQDGVLEAAGNIVDRMAELKSLYMDVLKSGSDKANYDTEFKDIQLQLYQISQEKFNGVSLFAATTGKVFGTDNVTVSVYVSDQGSAGAVVSVNKSLLLSAVNFTSASDTTNVASDTAGKSFAATSTATAIGLDELGVSFFTQALENVATLRAGNGGTTSRLQFALDHVTRSQTNLGRRTVESWMSTSPRRPLGWPSTTYSCRPPPRCSRRQMQLQTQPSCYWANSSRSRQANTQILVENHG